MKRYPGVTKFCIKNVRIGGSFEHILGMKTIKKWSDLMRIKPQKRNTSYGILSLPRLPLFQGWLAMNGGPNLAQSLLLYIKFYCNIARPIDDILSMTDFILQKKI